MGCPCETRTSTCRSFATISSGLYRFLAITVLLDVKDIPQVGPLQWGRITRASDTETLQSQVNKAAQKRRSLSGLEVFHGRRFRNPAQPAPEPMPWAGFSLGRRRPANLEWPTLCNRPWAESAVVAGMLAGFVWSHFSRPTAARPPPCGTVQSALRGLYR